MKILIVDDHEYNRELLSFILEDEGYDHDFAVNGQDACDKCRADDNINLILMDVTMPVMDGIEATRIIKREKQGVLIPIIFVTALDDVDILSNCLDAGGDDFIPKPVVESVLLAKIKAHGRTMDLYKNLQEANRQLEYHKQVIDREHMIVERIFDRGSGRIKTDCVNVTKYTSPMSMFNGDIVLEAPSPSGGVYNLVGDFTGHGLTASIGTLPVTEIFYRFASQQANVGLLAKEINTSLVGLLPDNMFFCAAITYLDSSGQVLSLWAGGMNDVLHVEGDETRTVNKIPSEHMPLGILLEEEFDETPLLLELNNNDRIYIYTDGVNEAENPENEQFGLQRIEDIVCSPADNAVKLIIDAVRDFQHEEGQNDDLSLLEIRASTLVHRDKNTQEDVDIKAQNYVADSFPWRFSMRLENNELKNTSIVDQLMVFVGGIQGIELHREKIFTIVSELYSNSLEHGVLGLDSSLKDSADGFEEYYRLRKERLDDTKGKFIDLEFLFKKGEPNQVQLSLTDSGEGFNIDAVVSKLESNDEAHGRGLYLLYDLCSSLTYSDGGRTVTAVYDLCLN